MRWWLRLMSRQSSPWCAGHVIVCTQLVSLSTVLCSHTHMPTAYIILARMCLLAHRPILSAQCLLRVTCLTPCRYISGMHSMCARAALELTVAALPAPQDGFVESFNISVAAALIMYEARQQRLGRLGRHGDLTSAQQTALKAAFMMRSVVGGCVARSQMAKRWHAWVFVAAVESCMLPSLDRWMCLCAACIAIVVRCSVSHQSFSWKRSRLRAQQRRGWCSFRWAGGASSHRL